VIGKQPSAVRQATDKKFPGQTMAGRSFAGDQKEGLITTDKTAAATCS